MTCEVNLGCCHISQVAGFALLYYATYNHTAVGQLCENTIRLDLWQGDRWIMLNNSDMFGAFVTWNTCSWRSAVPMVDNGSSSGNVPINDRWNKAQPLFSKTLWWEMRRGCRWRILIFSFSFHTLQRFFISENAEGFSRTYNKCKLDCRNCSAGFYTK